MPRGSGSPPRRTPHEPSRVPHQRSRVPVNVASPPVSLPDQQPVGAKRLLSNSTRPHFRMKCGGSSKAAIAALHAQAPRAADTDWPQIAALFGELHMRAPTPVIALNHAVAIAMARGPESGLPKIDALADVLGDYHLFHAARADLLRRLGKTKQAIAAYRAALALAGSEPEKRFLQRRLVELST